MKMDTHLSVCSLVGRLHLRSNTSGLRSGLEGRVLAGGEARSRSERMLTTSWIGRPSVRVRKSVARLCLMQGRGLKPSRSWGLLAHSMQQKNRFNRSAVFCEWGVQIAKAISWVSSGLSHGVGSKGGRQAHSPAQRTGRSIGGSFTIAHCPTPRRFWKVSNSGDASVPTF